MSAIGKRLRLLEDERDILRTMYTYAHAIDYDFEDEFVDCWVEDAVLYWPGHERLEGRVAIGAAFREHTHAPLTYHKHLVIEPRIRVDGGEAFVDSYYVRLDAHPDGPKVRSFGRYRDIMVRCPDGRWRFRERRAESEATIPGLPPSPARAG